MKHIALLILLLLPCALFAQYPNNPNKIRLGFQTTGNGLIYRGSGAPTQFPTGYNSPFQQYDTIANVLWVYQDSFWYATNTVRRATPPPYSSTSSGLTLVYGHATWQDSDDEQRYEYISNDSIEAWVPAVGIYYATSEPADIAATPTTGAVEYTAALWNKVPTDSLFRHDGANWVFIGKSGPHFVRGDSGALQDIAEGDTLTITGGYGVNVVTAAGDTVTVIVDTTQIATQYDLSQISTSFIVDADTGTPQTIASGDTLQINSGWGVNTTVGATGLITVTGDSTQVATLYDVSVVQADINTHEAADGDLSATNEIQQIDTFSFSSPTLSISLSSDGVAAKTANLSGLLTGYVTGSGTAGRVPRWTSSSALGDGVLRDDGTLLALGGATVSGYSFYDYSTGGWRLATGTTAQRPTGQAGAVRFNTTGGLPEFHNGTRWGYIPPAAGVFTTGRIPFSNANAQLTDNVNFVYDATNTRLGIGTSSPLSPIHVVTSQTSAGVWPFTITNNASSAYVPGYVLLAPNLGAGQYLYYSVGKQVSPNDLLTAEYVHTANGSALNRFSFKFHSGSYNITMLPGNKTGIGNILAPVNTLDVEGALAVGATYSGTNTAPSNGMLVEGNVGIGTTTPANKLDVEGAAVIGATYSGTNTAPSNGMLVEGNVRIGTTTHNIHTSERITINSNTAGDSPTFTLKNSNSGGYTYFSALDNLNRQVTFGVANTLAPTDAGKAFFTVLDTLDFIIETSNITRLNILKSGLIGVGSHTPVRLLDVNGEVRIRDLTTDAPTRIVGADADGDLGAVSEGYGINVTGGALEVDTTQIATQSDLASVSVTTLYTGDGTIATDRTVTIDDNYALITSGSPGVLSFTGTSGYVSSLSAYGYAYEIADTAFYITNATVKQSGSGSTIWYIQAGRQDATTLAVAEVNGDGGVTLGSIKTAGESSLVLDGQSITHTADLSHITKIGATTIHTTTSTGLGINDTSPEKSLDVGGMGKFRQLSGQDNSVTIGTNANMGTGRSASVTGSQSSDVAGRFSFTSGTGLTAGEWVTLTWAVAFDNPPAVQLFPEDGDGASLAGLIYVVPTTTGVSIGVNTNSASYESKTYEFNYIVIQGK